MLISLTSVIPHVKCEGDDSTEDLGRDAPERRRQAAARPVKCPSWALPWCGALHGTDCPRQALPRGGGCRTPLTPARHGAAAGRSDAVPAKKSTPYHQRCGDALEACDAGLLLDCDEKLRGDLVALRERCVVVE